MRAVERRFHAVMEVRNGSPETEVAIEQLDHARRRRGVAAHRSARRRIGALRGPTRLSFSLACLTSEGFAAAAFYAFLAESCAMKCAYHPGQSWSAWPASASY